MTDSRASTAFWPKQIIPPTPENYKELAKDGAERLAAVSLQQIPAIPAGAVIHDNGCGYGSATAVIMASAAPEVSATYQITGTDISGGAVEVYCDRADSSGWPAKGLVMDSDKLKFQDEIFTHTIGNAMIFVGPRNNGIDAVKEMYRTLKPRGTLILNCFAYVPVLEPIREASRVTRTGAILPAWTSFEEWTDPAFIANIVEAGGFKKIWSMRGMPSTGWSREDEERWDEALEIVRREMRKTEGFKTLDDGTTVIRSLINVATATK
ncbi:hypothetical protein TrVFT333_006220 [Trichoderma virens FT-333]|nr:hypothetical protein TrVFT333_006220 [Trichoderma virens FT-333]